MKNPFKKVIESDDYEEQEASEFHGPEAQLEAIFQTIAEVIVYFISLGFLISVSYVLYLMLFPAESEPKHQEGMPNEIRVKNEPESERMERLYYYDSTNSFYH